MESLERVRRGIREASRRAGRDPSEVTLVAVSKTFSAARVLGMIAAGHDVFGENRVQEALAKIEAVGPAARWHFVGALQRNKAKHVVGRFDLVHSVDGEPLARELDKRAAASGLVQPVLVQVNQALEATKSGVPEEALEPLVETILGLGNLELRGLMSIPPPARIPEGSRRWFAGLRELRDRVRDRLGCALPDLSMGMTDDFEVAVEEGATIIRVGRALFGERQS